MQHHISDVFINDRPISVVEYTKFLGVYIDENLNWRQQINEVCRKLAKITGILYRTRHNLTKDVMMDLYYSIFYPHMTYCVSIWASTWPSFLKSVQISQNKFLRCIHYMKKYQSTQEIYNTNNILNFSSIHMYFSTLLIYKMSRMNSPFKFVDRERQTRANNINLLVPSYRTELFKNSVLYSAPKHFNTFPMEIRKLFLQSSYSIFKKHLKIYLRARQLG